MFPVFSLVLDEDVPSDIALIYPELYKDLGKVGDTNPGILVMFTFDYNIFIRFLKILFSTCQWMDRLWLAKYLFVSLQS